MYKSTDGGGTWTNVGLTGSDAVGRIVVNPSNTRTRSGSPRRARSTPRPRSAGSTTRPTGWPDLELALAPPNSTTGGIDIALAPGNPNRVYAALWDHHRDPCCPDLRRRRLGPLPLRRRRRDLDTSSDDHRCAPDLRRARKPGSPRATRASGGSASRSRPAIRTGSTSSRVPQYGGDKGFFVSNDGGNTFQTSGRLENNPAATRGGSAASGSIRGNENHLFGADVSLRQSTNGGTTWTTVSNPAHSDQHAMAWDLSTINSTEPGDRARVPRKRRRHLPQRHRRDRERRPGSMRPSSRSTRATTSPSPRTTTTGSRRASRTTGASGRGCPRTRRPPT